MKITSPAFSQGQPIPTQFTCDGENVSPALVFEDIPAEAKSLALICDDPDAPVGVWDHWLLYNIPATATGLPQNIAPEIMLPDGATHGLNSWRNVGYGGPCPPSGTHRYYFKLYALDAKLNLKAGVDKGALARAMDGHVLTEARLMGTYSRGK